MNCNECSLKNSCEYTEHRFNVIDPDCPNLESNVKVKEVIKKVYDKEMFDRTMIERWTWSNYNINTDLMGGIRKWK